MPVSSDLSITSCTYNKPTKVLTVKGVAFGENQYPVSAVAYSIHGAGVWVATTITSWSDTQVVCSTVATLSGVYDIRITNSDNEQYTGSSALNNLAYAPSQSRLYIGVAIAV